jgi:hypothetical protein
MLEASPTKPLCGYNKFRDSRTLASYRNVWGFILGVSIHIQRDGVNVPDADVLGIEQLEEHFGHPTASLARGVLTSFEKLGESSVD